MIRGIKYENYFILNNWKYVILLVLIYELIYEQILNT